MNRSEELARQEKELNEKILKEVHDYSLNQREARRTRRQQAKEELLDTDNDDDDDFDVEVHYEP